MFCLYTFPLARPAQAKIQNLTVICCIVKLIPWNVVNLSHLYILEIKLNKTYLELATLQISNDDGVMKYLASSAQTILSSGFPSREYANYQS